MSHDRILIKGNEAVAFGALDAGCRCYFGYPITPQNEIPETMSLRLPECGGQFVQAESEVAAINMLLGAGACGIPAMTSSSSCGISLMQEGISYMAGSHIPAVIVNMERGGPGLGDIGPSQGDYFQAVKGGGHGDHRNLVLAPSTAQECYDMMFRAFALAFKYANPVMLLGDAIVAQIKEPVRRQPPADALSPEALAELAAPWRMEGYGKRGPGASPCIWPKAPWPPATACSWKSTPPCRPKPAPNAGTPTTPSSWWWPSAPWPASPAAPSANCARKASRRACSVPRRSIPSRPTPCAPWPRAAVSWSSSRTPARWWKTCACP